MYEHHTEGLLPRRLFFRRVAQHSGIAAALLVVSLAIGTVGFHFLAPQLWLDALLNSSMLLGGMGPVGVIQFPSGKIFASLYALYAGIVFIGASALFLAPIIHRVLHKLRVNERVRR